MNECVGIVVDGEGDYASLRRRFQHGYKVLKTDGPRGHTAHPNEIARKSRKQIGILSAFRCKHAIVMLDFEQRADSYCRFLRDLRRCFQAIGFPIPVSVAVPNRMIENWYLADIAYISRRKVFLRDRLSQKNYEGTNGKKELKRCMKPSVSYSETKHGPQLFKILRFRVARQNSESFDDFLSQIENA